MSRYLLSAKRHYWVPLLRRFVKSCGRFRQFSRSDRSNLPIDIVIPLAPKDLPVFRLCLKGLRENLLHPLNAVHVVAPCDPSIVAACSETDCQFVDERDLLPEGPEHYEELLAHTRLKRGKWVYQQFLKLQAGQLLGLHHFLIFDSDTVMINPFKYEIAGKLVLEFSDGFRSELDGLHSKLVPGMRLQPFSFMCHAMLMNTTLVEKLLDVIQESTGKDWKTGILEMIDTNEDLCFSEYELYGNFVSDPSFNPLNDRKFLYWFNKAYPRAKVNEIETLKQESAGKYRTLSFHSYQK